MAPLADKPHIARLSDEACVTHLANSLLPLLPATCFVIIQLHVYVFVAEHYVQFESVPGML